MYLVVRMSKEMYSYLLVGCLAGVEYCQRAIAVAEAESRLLIAVHSDLESG